MRTKMLFIVTEKGQGIKLEEKQVGKTKEYIKLAKGDSIISKIRYNDEEIREILLMTHNGFGFRFSLSDIRVMGVGGPGVKCIKLSLKTGVLVGVEKLYSDIEDLKIRTKMKKTASIAIVEIPILRRGAQGVRLIKLEKGDKIIDLKIK